MFESWIVGVLIGVGISVGIVVLLIVGGIKTYRDKNKKGGSK